MATCRGCGSELSPTQEQVDRGFNEILEASLKDAIKHGEICPLCGHSKAVPVPHRKPVLFALLVGVLMLAGGLAVSFYLSQDTERQAAAQQALQQIETNTDVQQLLGRPLRLEGKIQGQVRQDETGWHETNLTFPIHGPKVDGIAHVSGGRESGPWKFTTLEVMVPRERKRIDLVSGQVVEFDPDAYQPVHSEPAAVPESITAEAPPPSRGGDFPCVFAKADPTWGPQIGNCAIPVPMSPASRTPLDRFENDLRTGKFILRQSDLVIDNAGLEVPLTRTYTSQDWLTSNPAHAFGLNANHPYDVAPAGTRNPYTRQFIVLEDGDFLYFPRISKGTGYADAVYWQTETGASFYKATTRWDGNGWETKLEDGSTIHFPESYNAQNMAQGAPTDMTDAEGNKIQLVRDGRRNLQEILAPGGQWLKFTYDGQDRIFYAQDDRGDWVKYSYSPASLLTDVMNSAGQARHYTYDGRLLTSVQDGLGHFLIRNWYQGGWLSQQQFANGEVYRYSYELADNGRYAEQATITLPDGTTKTIRTGDFVSGYLKKMR
jgi:YD repeat-containing protein